MSIDWAAFSWEAFSTLGAGLLAVLAAAFVGKRQLKLLEGQNELKEQEIRVSLLERRLEVYDAVHQFFAQVMRTGNEVNLEDSQAFHGARLKARFLFSVDLNEFLKEVWSKNCDLGLYRTMSRGGGAKDENERVRNVRKASETLKWFVEEFGNLHERFEEIRPH